MSREHLHRQAKVHGVSGNVVGTTDTQTLTNKTLTSPVITGLPSLVPTGAVLMFGGGAAPTGYYSCDGSAKNTTTDAALFAVIGYTYGGAGSSFNLPNFTNLFPRGNTPGTGAGADTHTHTFDDGGHTHTSAAHAHTLSDAGQAQVRATSGTSLSIRAVAGNWTSTTKSTGLTNGAGGAETFGAALQGSTDSTTPGATGSTHAAGTTASGSNVPAYTGVMFIIKA